MDDTKRKQVMIAIVVVCLVCAVGITVITNMGGGGGGGGGYDSNKKILLLCGNPDCGAITELTGKEYVEKMRQSTPEGGPMMMPMMGPMAVECGECGEQSAYLAVECKECQAVFVENFMSSDYPDRCPDCGYSEIEEKRSKRK